MRKFLREIRSVEGGNRFACVVDAVYPLFLYLLIRTEDEVADTVFFFGKTIPQSVAQRLGRYFYATNYEWNGTDSPLWRERLRIRLKFLVLNLFFVRGRKVFAQDHLTYSGKILCRSRYTWLEDAPGSYRAMLGRVKPVRGFANLWEDFLYEGDLHGRLVGTGPQCVNRLVSREEDVQAAEGRHERVDIRARWEALCPGRKKWMLDLFGVSEEMLRDFRARDTVIFTQPLMLDCGIGMDETLAIFGPLVERYGEENVLIKVHPRDFFDYAAIFPRARIARVIVPMQLLNFVLPPFKRAITVCSTAVIHLPPETEVIWLGTRVNEKILNRYGEH